MRICAGTSCSVLALVASLACGESASFDPTNETVVGSYEATQLLTSDDRGTIDWIGRGARIDLHLLADGRTSGHLFVPAGAEGGFDENQDLTGTWELRGSTVYFTMLEDTFIDDMPWTASLNRLTGDYHFISGTRVRAVFGKYVI